MLGTVFFYNLIVLSSTFFVYFSEKCKYRFDRNILLFIAFLIIFIPSAIRYNIGTDFPNYIYIYDNLESHTHMEPGFYYINKLLRFVNARAQWSIAVLAFIFSYAAIFSYPKKDAWILHLAFTLSLLFFSFNGIRQAIAIAFSLWAFKHYLYNKLLTASLLIFIGSLFHAASLILLPIGLIALIPLPKKFKELFAPIIIITSILLLNFFTPQLIGFLELITNKLNLKYQVYFGHNRHFIAPELGSGLGLLAKFLFPCFIIFRTKSLINKNPKLWALIILNSLYAVSIILTKEIIIFGRLEKVLAIAPIIGVYYLFQLEKRTFINSIIAIFFILFLLLVFEKDAVGKPSSYSNPRLNPYQTIFNYD